MKKDLKSKIKMPVKKLGDMEVDQDLDMLGEDLDMLEAEDSEISEEVGSDLEMIADEDLIKEVKKRGLSLDSVPEESEEIDEESEADELEAIDLSEEEEI